MQYIKRKFKKENRGKNELLLGMESRNEVEHHKGVAIEQMVEYSSCHVGIGSHSDMEL